MVVCFPSLIFDVEVWRSGGSADHWSRLLTVAELGVFGLGLSMCASLVIVTCWSVYTSSVQIHIVIQLHSASFPELSV